MWCFFFNKLISVVFCYSDVFQIRLLIMSNSLKHESIYSDAPTVYRELKIDKNCQTLFTEWDSMYHTPHVPTCYLGECFLFVWGLLFKTHSTVCTRTHEPRTHLQCNFQRLQPPPTTQTQPTHLRQSRTRIARVCTEKRLHCPAAL